MIIFIYQQTKQKKREVNKMNRNKKFIILDTETCNTIEQPIPYDIGWVIADKYGNIYEERSYVISEIFFGMKDVMQSAYYANKIPMYYEDIKNNKRVVAQMWDIRRQLIEDMNTYNTKRVGAYNMGFDKRALNNLIRYVSKSWKRFFFPFGTEYFDIWNCACELLMARKTYIDFAIKNNLISDKNNILTSAESVYKYITDNKDFIESHTGLEDCKIETKIFAECYRQKKKMNVEISPYCWKKVQKKRKELDLRAVYK